MILLLTTLTRFFTVFSRQTNDCCYAAHTATLPAFLSRRRRRRRSSFVSLPPSNLWDRSEICFCKQATQMRRGGFFLLLSISLLIDFPADVLTHRNHPTLLILLDFASKVILFALPLPLLWTSETILVRTYVWRHTPLITLYPEWLLL